MGFESDKAFLKFVSTGAGRFLPAFPFSAILEEYDALLGEKLVMPESVVVLVVVVVVKLKTFYREVNSIVV